MSVVDLVSGACSADSKVRVGVLYTVLNEEKIEVCDRDMRTMCVNQCICVYKWHRHLISVAVVVIVVKHTSS